MLKRNKKLNAIIALGIIITMTFYYFIYVGVTTITYAIDVVKTNHTNIDFYAYFINSNGEKVESIEGNIDNENQYLYVDIKVKNEGYFNGTICLNDNNFNLKQEKLSDEISQISGNAVTLNQINAGSTITIKLGIEAIKEININESMLDKQTEVILKGQYVNSQNVEKDKYIEINGTTQVKMSWKSSTKTQAEVEASLLTNYIYDIKEEEKRVLQVIINSKITDNNYPVKNTELILNVPKNVEEVEVHARSTEATNSNINFDNNNYSYDQESGQLIINLSNEDINNISWNQNAEDKIIVTYVLPLSEELSTQNIFVQDTITTYDNKQISSTKNVSINEEIDGILSYSLENTESSIYKGKLYTEQERDYTITNTINIDYLNVVKKLELTEETTYIANNIQIPANIIYKETKIDKKEFLKVLGEDGYLTIKNSAGVIIANINKDSETDENGKIIITYPEMINEIIIQTSEPISVGLLKIEHTKTILSTGYARNIIDALTGIKEKVNVNDIEKTKIIDLNNTETVADLNVDVTTISTIVDNQQITLEATLETNDESKDLYKNPNIIITLPKEITVISAQYASLYKNGLEVENTNISKNENGEYEVNIKFIGEQEKYDSIGGTKIYLKLDVKTSKLTPTKTSSIKMTYTNEFKNETKTINAELNFESQYGLMIYNQINDYNNEGESIVTVDSESVYGSIDTNTESKEITIGTAIINNFGETISDITLIGTIPSGDGNDTYGTTLNKIEIDNSSAILSYSTNANALADDESWGEYTEGAVAYKIEIPEMAEEEVTKIKITTILPENIKYNQSGDFTTWASCNYKNQQQTNSSDIILATSNNIMAEESAVASIQNTESGLEVSVNAIVGNNGLSDGDNIYEGGTIRYEITVINNTENDYNNVLINATQVNGYIWDYIQKEEYNYNYGETYLLDYYEITDLNDIELGTIETLAKGESYTFEYESSTYQLNNENIIGTQTYGIISITSEEDELNEQITTIKNNIIKAELQIDIFDGYYKTAKLESGETVKSTLSLTNITDETLSDIEVQIAYSSNLNAEVSLLGLDDSVYYESEETGNNEITIIKLTILSLAAGENIKIKLFPTTADSFEEDEIEVWVMAEAITNEENYYVSNKFTRTVYDISHDIELTQKGLFEDGSIIDVDTDILNDGDVIKLIATISNQEEEELIIDINYEIDKKINIESAIISSLAGEENIILKQTLDDDGDEEKDYDGYVLDNSFNKNEMTIEPGEKITITIEGKVNAMEIESLTNTLDVYDFIAGKMTSTQLSFLVNTIYDDEDNNNGDNNNEDNNNGDDNNGDDNNGEDNNGEDNNGEDNNGEDNNGDNNNVEDNNGDNNNGEDNNGDNNNGEDNNGDNNKVEDNNGDTNEIKNEYKILGTVWIDINKDGIKDPSEEVVSNIEVVALNVDTNTIIDNVTTNADGSYAFSLPEGNYMILFYYDSTVYTTTTYQVSGANSSENSDVIERDITINGVTETVATTDVINLTKNLNNIDVGLIYRSKFDLSIKKYINKITVSNDSGTTTYNQKDDTTFAKAEIKSKYLSGSLVVIEYTIKVTNIGEIEGYAKNIVDYMPSSLTFNSSLNPDWYLSKNNLYNNSLSNTKIKPGETKELTLVLTKTMTESNTGLINNKVEINESSNLLGIEDETNEKGSADVIINVSTGVLVNYVATTMITLFILIGLAYLVNKKYESKRKQEWR